MKIEKFPPVKEETTNGLSPKKRKGIKRVVIPMMILSIRWRNVRCSRCRNNQRVYGCCMANIIRRWFPDEQMERFKFMLDYSDEAVEMYRRLLVWENWYGGQSVQRVWEGELVEVDGKAKVVAGLDLPMLGWYAGGFVEKMEMWMADARKCGGEFAALGKKGESNGTLKKYRPSK